MSNKAESTNSRDAHVDLRYALKALPPLTERQADCLRYILDYFLQYKFYPTQREIAKALKLRSSTAESYLGPLVRMGYLSRVPRRRRNIELTTEAVDKLELMGVNVRESLTAA